MRSQVNISRDLMQSLKSCLEELCRAVNAQQALLFNPMGQPVVSLGGTEGLDLDLLVPLIANGIAAIKEASSIIEQEEGFTIYYHSGSNFDFYGASINQNLMILLKLDRPQNQTRIGTVLYYLQQAVKSMRAIFPELLLDESFELDHLESVEQIDPLVGRSVPNRSEEIPQGSSELAAESGGNGDDGAPSPGRLLSYFEAETQGLISNEP